jgi:hypothetical protein
MARHLACLAMSLLFISFGYGQTSATGNKPCLTAQVLLIEGKWVVGQHTLEKWDCLQAGDEVSQADDADGGKITVIYHQEAKPPFTKACPTRCRNGFKIEPPPERENAGKSPADTTLDFFFSIFPKSGTKPVPGLLRGSLSPEPPAILCTEDRQVNLVKNLRQEYLVNNFLASPQTHTTSWELYPPSKAIDTGIYQGLGDDDGWEILLSQIEEKPKKYKEGHKDLMPLAHVGEFPLVYTVKVGGTENGAPPIPVVVAVASGNSCAQSKTAYLDAVSYTLNWPVDTPKEARQDFIWTYWRGVVNQQAHIALDKLEKAPKDEKAPN